MNYESYEELLYKAQHSEDPKTWYWLAKKHCPWYGEKKDGGEYVFWLGKAAGKKYKPALNELGFLYAYGLCVEKDAEKAFGLHSEAAANSIPPGADQYKLAQGFRYNTFFPYIHDLERDYEKAFYWYKKSAEAGFAPAYLHLGEMYRDGLGTARNYRAALNWFQKYVDEKENALALLAVGDCYYNGWGVEQDYETAAAYYKRAADKDEDFSDKLADCYEKGLGVPKDESMAETLRARIHQSVKPWDE